ncbi:hypothetical protein SAMN04515679_0467 [Pelosinus fermentans]|jgi:hypothetical protein|uniref:Uncharacterized protein n=1 Tax=Pelosinus fermentans B4 TaxID=1149862 RepID=I8R9Z2_9FIRM|nr:hypothetical protein FB4_1347 [Pelosinus fermentans B4]EIW26652.1 hypothetical protein FA11_1656 [Pelosinus fermentans A11]OAM92403.1 hypothetical protein FR7_00419 [Pelosinus fermentans DSM 17108]SDQ43690.1 hypothetical protein SAMN04515679_0467 [Pelosinus fermentans]
MSLTCHLYRIIIHCYNLVKIELWKFYKYGRSHILTFSSKTHKYIDLKLWYETIGEKVHPGFLLHFFCKKLKKEEITKLWRLKSTLMVLEKEVNGSGVSTIACKAMDHVKGKNVWRKV